MHLDELLDSRELAGTNWSVDLRRDGDRVYQRDADQLLETASLAKVFVLVELASRLHDGTIDPRSRLSRRKVARVADSGLWQHLASDHLPVADVATLVGAVSDNLATNVLIDLLGLESVKARASTMAPGGSSLLDLVRDTRTSELPPTLSEGCASDWVAVFEDLRRGAGEGEAVGSSVLGWLSTGTDLSLVASAFELDPLSHGSSPDHGVRLWNKTGTDLGVRADAGVVQTGATTWTYAAICNWEDREPGQRSAVLAALRELGTAIRQSA